MITIALTIVLAAALVFLAKKQSNLQQALFENQTKVDRLMDELKAIYAGAAGQGSHIARLEQKMHSLSDRQEQLDEKDPASQGYSEAIELIHSGASAEELIRRGLRREEAELLIRMHSEQSLG